MKPPKLESLAQTIVLKRFTLLIFFCTACYLALASFATLRPPLWFDEINTALLAKLNFADLWNALISGADTNPPILYLPVHALYLITSNPKLATRAPAIVLWLLAMVCIYFLSRKYVSRIYALFAAFVPFFTTAGVYAVEGRSYAATIGFGAAAILSWRTAADGKFRKICLLTLLVTLALALGGHYSAALFVPVLIFGEIIRSYIRRCIDWQMILMIGVGTAIPLAATRSFMPAIHRYLLSYWSNPSFVEVIRETLYMLIPKRTVMFTLVSIALLAYAHASRFRSADLEYKAIRIEKHELFAWLTLLGAPILGYLQGRVTGGFTMRYALPAVISIAIFAAIGSYRVALGAFFPGFLLVLLGMFCCASHMVLKGIVQTAAQKESSWLEMQQSSFSGIIVVGNPQLFSSLYFNESDSLRERLLYLCGPDLSTRYLHMNSADLNLSELRHFVSIPVRDYREYVAQNLHFVLLHDNADWTLSKLREDSATITKLSCSSGGSCLYDIRILPNPQIVF